MILLFLSIVSIIGIAFALSFNKKIFAFLKAFIEEIRIFMWENKSMVDTSFLVLYAIIQFIFIWAVTVLGVELGFAITIFILLLLTTMGIERLCLRSRYNHLDNQNNRLNRNYLLNEVECQRLLTREKELLSRYSVLQKENQELIKKL